MEKNVILKFTAESDVSKLKSDLDSLRAREKDLLASMDALKKKQDEFQGAPKVIKLLDDEYKKLEKDLNANNKSISELSDKIKKINGGILDGAVSTPKFTTQLRAMKDELAKMEDAGQFGTKAFTDLAIKAGQLEDQVGDTRQRIRTLSSDTKNLDAAMSLGQGLAGGFTVATSAAALLGGESEELQKAFFKVQAVLQILNGVQMVANTLNKDSVANVVLQTALENSNTVAKIKNTVSKYANATASALEASAEKGNAVAKVGSTVAQWALNSAMLANPALWVVGGIMALVGAFIIFKSIADDTKKVQERLNYTLKSTSEEMERIDSSADFDIRIAEASGKSVAEIRKIRFEAIKTKIALAEMASDEVYRAGNKATKEQIEESQKMMKDAINAEKKYFDDAVVEDLTARKKASDKRRDLSKQASDKAQQEREKRNQEIAQAQSDLDDLLNDMMTDGMIKEISVVQTTYERKRAAIKGNSDSESQLLESLKDKENQEIQKIETKYANQNLKTAKELELLKAQNAEAGSVNDIALKKATLERQLELDIIGVNQSTDTEEIKNEKIVALRLKLKEDLEKIDTDENKRQLDNTLKMLDGIGSKLNLANKKAYADGLITKEEYEKASEDISTQGLENEIELRKKNGEDTIELEQQLADKRIAIKEKEADAQAKMWAHLYETGKELMGIYFDYQKDRISQQLEDLDNYYTTDAEEAKSNADKKLITEKALAQKKLELKRKQAMVEKQEALFNIALSTAQAVMGIWKDFPKADFGIMATIMSAATIALGAVQAGIVLGKPLPQYAKGRKGGRGEFALVGEKGPETMWVPDGASIIPAHRRLTPATLQEFGIQIPVFDDIELQGGKLDIDYDKLGKAVGKNIQFPNQKTSNVTVNVDKSGINVQDGNLSTTYLNKKYTGQWN